MPGPRQGRTPKGHIGHPASLYGLAHHSSGPNTPGFYPITKRVLLQLGFAMLRSGTFIRKFDFLGPQTPAAPTPRQDGLPRVGLWIEACAPPGFSTSRNGDGPPMVQRNPVYLGLDKEYP